MLEKIEKDVLRFLIETRAKNLDWMQETIDQGRKDADNPGWIARLDRDQEYVDNARKELEAQRARYKAEFPD